MRLPGTWTRGCGLLAAAVAQHLAHGAANDAGHVMAQVAHAFFHQVESAFDFVESALDFIEAAIDLIKSLLCLRLEAEQVPVDAFDLLGEKFGRAFELAYTALQIANLCLDLHGHRNPLSQQGLRALQRLGETADRPWPLRRPPAVRPPV